MFPASDGILSETQLSYVFRKCVCVALGFFPLSVLRRRMDKPSER